MTFAWLGDGVKLVEDIGIDLGTANFLVYIRGKGIVLQEPSVIAMVRDSKEVKAVGEEAYRMIGRTPGNIVAVRPIKDGVIADFELTKRMLTKFLDKVITGYARFLRPTIMVGVPSGVTNLEKRGIISAVRERARKVYLIEEPMAAAIGAGVQIAEPTGSIIVDIGGGSTDIAVISLGGIVVSRSIKIAGNEFDEAIIKYVRRKENLMIGERSSEELKVKIGAAILTGEDSILTAEVRGRDLINGLPKTVQLTSADIAEALQEPVQKIVDLVKQVLESTPPELVSDIIDRGIILTGGGAMLRNLDERLRQATGIPVIIAPNAIQAVALGTGKALEMIPILRDALDSSENYLGR
jgi:rod shape-determining protein MreB and related proteins